MKRTLITLILLAQSFATFAFDFRASNWDDSTKTVLATEKATLIGQDFENQAIGYKTELALIPMTILFQFHEDKLYQGSYFGNARHLNSNLYVNDYERVQKLLIKKYGEPKKAGEIWQVGDSLFIDKEDKNDWGMAILKGELSLGSLWEVENTQISHMLGGRNFSVNHIINYQSMDSKVLMESVEEENDLNQL